MIDYTTKRVVSLLSPYSNKAVPNQFMIDIDIGWLFQSYESVVAFRSNSGKVKMIRKDFYKFSSTTTRYTSHFLWFDSAYELHKAVKNKEVLIVSDSEFHDLLEFHHKTLHY